MNKFYLTSMIAAFLLLFTNCIQAQTTQAKLDQLKLMQDWIGTSQQDYGIDTLEVMDFQQYGNAFIGTINRVINGKKSYWCTYNYLYSPKENKFRVFVFWPNGRYQTMIGSFTTEKKFCADIVQDFNPEKVLRRVETVAETPENYTATFINLDGVRSRPFKWYKVK